MMTPMDDGLLGSYTAQMIACGVWLVLALIAAGAITVLVWLRKTPEWRTQVNAVTGERTAGLRNYLIGWGSVLTSGPLTVALALTVRRVVDLLMTYPWLPPVACFAAVTVAVGVVIGRRVYRERALTPRTPDTPHQPELTDERPHVYDVPYGQY